LIGVTSLATSSVLKVVVPFIATNLIDVTNFHAVKLATVNFNFFFKLNHLYVSVPGPNTKALSEISGNSSGPCTKT
jgi:hypothetical protein